MPAWPSYAKLQLEGYAEQRESGLKSSEMDSGPPKVVLVKSRVMVRRPVRVLLTTTANYLAFVAWFETDIKLGSKWFDWFDPVRKVTVQARIKDGDFQATPLARVSGGKETWAVSLTLETWQ